MARIAVFIDHDIMVRHFVLTGVLEPLEREHDVVYVFPEHKRVTVDVDTLPVPRLRKIAVSGERAQLFRRLYMATALMKLRRTPDKQVMFDFWRHVLGRDAFLEAWFYSWPWTNVLYRTKMLEQIGENRLLEALLAEERPDLILHPTVLEGLFVSDLVRWGETHGVPTVFLMNSWDNPAVKAMLLGSPHRLVVWGEHSRRLAHERMGIPTDRLLAFGAAQFDVYRRPPRESPEDYRRRLGVASDVPILLYAGSSKGLNETRHLEALEAAVDDGRLPRCVVLYRPHPWRAKGKGERSILERTWRHVRLAPDMAEYYRRTWQGDESTFMADYEETHVTLSAVDAVVSPLSTILLEAAMHGKPIAAYLADEDAERNLHLFTATRTIHFREFFARVDCGRIEQPEGLVPACAALLAAAANPANGPRLREQCEFFVAATPASYAEQLAALVRSLARAPRERRPHVSP